MFVKKNQSKSVLGENELDLRINSLNATKGKWGERNEAEQHLQL